MKLDKDGNIINSEVKEIKRKPKVEKKVEEVEEPVEEVEAEIVDETALSTQVNSEIAEDNFQFKPNKNQIRCKKYFHINCPPRVKQGFNPVQIDFGLTGSSTGVTIFDYIPTSEDAFKKWCKERGFWRWFLLDDDYVIEYDQSKVEAVKFLKEILAMSHHDEEGFIDYNMLRIKVGVAGKFIEKDKSINVTKTNNSVNVSVHQPTKLKNLGLDSLRNKVEELKGEVKNG